MLQSSIKEHCQNFVVADDRKRHFYYYGGKIRPLWYERIKTDLLNNSFQYGIASLSNHLIF